MPNSAAPGNGSLVQRQSPDSHNPNIPKPTPADAQKIKPVHLLLLLLLLATFIHMARAFVSIPIQRPGLEEIVLQNMPKSGAESPVTAVLLNFRGYDTLLEVTVLFLALLGCWSLNKAHIPSLTIDTSPVQKAVVRLLVPLMFVVAAYMVWQGSHFAGGAFQAGAVLASIGVLLLLSNYPWLNDVPVKLLRFGLLAGPLFFLLSALSSLLFGRSLLQYPPQHAGLFLLIIEIFCAASIGLTLASLFAGGRPENDAPPEEEFHVGAPKERELP